MLALERLSPYASPPDRFDPHSGQNAASSGICLPQFLQNMPGFLSVGCENAKKHGVSYHEIGKNQPEKQKNGKKDAPAVSPRRFRARKTPCGRKKRSRADKMPPFFGF
jgi:hypothetical protein